MLGVPIRQRFFKSIGEGESERCGSPPQFTEKKQREVCYEPFMGKKLQRLVFDIIF